MAVSTGVIAEQQVTAVLDDALQRAELPGAAAIVVREGAPIAVSTSGHLDVSRPSPVTTASAFPLASDTKALFAALACRFAATGELDLDAPVRDVVPDFVAFDDVTTRLVSLRDLLSHRSGLPRHDFAVHGSALTLAEITRRIRHLPPTRQLRTAWQYCNLGYCVAGHVLEVVAGRPWPQMLAEQILEPLGMTSTHATPAGDWAAEQVATAHCRIDDRWQQVSPPPDAFASPAGGLVTTIDDLGRWLSARLGHAPDVLPTGVLEELHRPAIVGGLPHLADPSWLAIGYALGCQVDVYRGHRLIRHGGNLAGYTTNVALLPDEGIGVAVLSNGHASALPTALPLLVVDALSGHPHADWVGRYQAELDHAAAARREATSRAAPRPDQTRLAMLCGRYAHPGYGELAVSEADGDLRLDLHGLGRRLQLKPDGEDRWSIQYPDFGLAFEAAFEFGADGPPAVMTVGFEPELPPIRFARIGNAATRPLVSEVSLAEPA